MAACWTLEFWWLTSIFSVVFIGSNMKRLKLVVAVLLAGAAFMACDDSASVSGADRGAVAKVDTVYVRDTIRVRDSVFVRDTLPADTVNVHDTIKVNVHDTLDLRDSLNVRDSLTVPDTVYKDSCSYRNADDGSVVVTCGESVQTLYATLCNGVGYDAEAKICVEGELKDRCGDLPYDKDKEICLGGRVYGSLTDTRDGKVYRTVTIGEQTWMAENLNYKDGYSVCGGGEYASSNLNTGNCAVYGRLYRWSTAMALEAKYDTASAASEIKSPHRGICPQGWHIPVNEEWQTLYNTLVTERPAIPYDVQMRSDSLWRFSEKDGGDGTVEPGQNSSGFNVLPAGRTWTNPEGTIYYYDEGRVTQFANATEMDRNWGSFNNAAFYNHDMNGKSYLVPHVGTGLMKLVYVSVRCVMDSAP